MYLAGLRVRNSRITECFRFLKDSEHWTAKQLQLHQLERARMLVARAYNLSSFYKEKFDAAGFRPDQLRSLRDMQRIPIVTKAELLAEHARIQLLDSPEGHFLAETSGSSGTPLLFYKNKQWDAWVNAAVFRGYSWFGVNPWERNGYFWGYNTATRQRLKIRILDFLQNRFRVFSYDDATLAGFLKRLKGADFLEGYSSAIYQIARRINDLGLADQYRLKLIKGTSEKILERYQQEAIKAFGRRIVSEYGAAEAGIIAFECPSGNMHITMETVILEAVDGEAVVTNLVSDSFPIIRYKVGDAIELDLDTPCGCGMMHSIVKEVLGRTGMVIHGKHGMYPSLTLYYVFKNLALTQGITLNYQAVQERKGQLALHVEGKVSESVGKRLGIELTKYFGDDVELSVISDSNLGRGSGKFRDFVSKLGTE
jgi:phenylacetate-CoA ligase